MSPLCKIQELLLLPIACDFGKYLIADNGSNVIGLKSDNNALLKFDQFDRELLIIISRSG